MHIAMMATISGFLRSRRDRVRLRKPKSKKKEAVDNVSNKEEKSDMCVTVEFIIWFIIF